jgi:hypothetical protein
MAPSVSERTAEECRELGLNWVDLAGNCHIQFDDVLVHIEGKPNVHIEKRGTSSLYTPRSSRVVHAILLEPLRTWKVADLAARTSISIGQVSNVRRLLLRDSFAQANGEGLQLADPKRLLADWARNYKPKRTASYYFSLKRPGELEMSLRDHLPSYALTELAAAERYAPYTRYQNVSFYTPKWLPSYAKALDLRPAENTANVAIYEDPDAILFSQREGAVMCASPIITYLDLILLGGRGQDAAEHLLETNLLPRWK